MSICSTYAHEFKFDGLNIIFIPEQMDSNNKEKFNFFVSETSDKTIDDYLKSLNYGIIVTHLRWNYTGTYPSYHVTILKTTDQNEEPMGIIYKSDEDYVIFKEGQIYDFNTELAKRADFLYHISDFKCSKLPFVQEMIQTFNMKIDYDQRVRQYGSEFKIKSLRLLHDPKEMTPDDIKYWKRFLKEEGVQTFNEYIESWLDGNESDLRVIEWYWIHDGQRDILIDMNYWPGDNEVGAIIMDDRIIFENQDQGLSSFEPRNKKEEELVEKRDVLEHIRSGLCFSNHEFCREIYSKLYED